MDEIEEKGLKLEGNLKNDPKVISMLKKMDRDDRWRILVFINQQKDKKTDIPAKDVEWGDYDYYGEPVYEHEDRWDAVDNDISRLYIALYEKDRYLADQYAFARDLGFDMKKEAVDYVRNPLNPTTEEIQAVKNNLDEKVMEPVIKAMAERYQEYVAETKYGDKLLAGWLNYERSDDRFGFTDDIHFESPLGHVKSVLCVDGNHLDDVWLSVWSGEKNTYTSLSLNEELLDYFADHLGIADRSAYLIDGNKLVEEGVDKEDLNLDYLKNTVAQIYENENKNKKKVLEFVRSKMKDMIPENVELSSKLAKSHNNGRDEYEIYMNDKDDPEDRKLLADVTDFGKGKMQIDVTDSAIRFNRDQLETIMYDTNSTIHKTLAGDIARIHKAMKEKKQEGNKDKSKSNKNINKNKDDIEW